MERELDFEMPIVELEGKISRLKELAENGKGSFDDQIGELETQLKNIKEQVYTDISPWQSVQIARHPRRPVLSDYISMIFDEFFELHGDRCIADDRALIGGFARIGKEKIMLIGHNKGKNVEENIERNFGMARPDGYRKALRLMKLAEKYKLPIVSFIDTAGAYPGLEAEERGQAEAIARNLTEMARLETPIICVVTGEGGSGGAIGIGVGDVVLMLSYSVYSVISPEGCASILWRDAAYSADAAKALKITAHELKELEVIDEIIAEPEGGAHRDYEATVEAVKKVLVKHLKKLKGVSRSRLVNRRFDKYSKIGKYMD
jgi:acetyl-CoA carboxylase carboxyl transferase subunit alpha